MTASSFFCVQFGIGKQDTDFFSGGGSSKVILCCSSKNVSFLCNYGWEMQFDSNSETRLGLANEGDNTDLQQQLKMRVEENKLHVIGHVIDKEDDCYNKNSTQAHFLEERKHWERSQ